MQDTSTARVHAFAEPVAITGISITLKGGLGPDGFIAQYVTFPNNNPATYTNKLYVWTAEDGTVPWNSATKGDGSIASDEPRGDQPLTVKIQSRGYVIGYAPGPDPNATAATVFIPADGHDKPETWEYQNVTIDVPYVGIDTIKVKYSGLNAYDPAANKNWIGIWRQKQIRYSGDALATVTITNPSEDGSIFIQGLDLRKGETYAVGYFTLPLTKPQGRTSLAAQASFSIV